MIGVDFILDSFKQEGIDHIFLLPGGLIDPFLPALAKHKTLKPIVAGKESGVAYMADGYARASKKFGVALCIGGPGLTNAMTAIATARSDGSPILVLSGEVATAYEGLGMFQDASSQTLNDVGMAKQITLYSTSIDNSKNLHHLFQHAMVKMLGEKKGPVHVSIPKDSQLARIDATYHPISQNITHAHMVDLKAAKASLRHFVGGAQAHLSKENAPIRIAVLAGSGIHDVNGASALLHFSEKFSIPVATTLRAKGVFPENHPNSLGVFGYAGTHHAKKALLDDAPDLLIVLGSGLNERDSMHWALKLNPKHTININISAVDLATQLCGSSVIGDASTYLHWLLENIDAISERGTISEKDAIPEKGKISERNTMSERGTISETLKKTEAKRRQWLSEIKATPRLQDPENCESNAIPIHPARVVSELRKALPPDCILLVDSGAHRAFAGHYWTAVEPFTYISATNLGPMGWAIPASVGVKCAKPDSTVVVITGDGCMHMEGIEIGTAARYQLNIIYVVINNAALGNVWLRLHKEGTLPSELTALPNVDWAGFAKSLGGHGITVTDPKHLQDAFTMAKKNKGPTVIDVKCDKQFTTPVSDWSSASAAWSYHE